MNAKTLTALLSAIVTMVGSVFTIIENDTNAE